jgi:hypothetical protein
MNAVMYPAIEHHQDIQFLQQRFNVQQTCLQSLDINHRPSKTISELFAFCFSPYPSPSNPTVLQRACLQALRYLRLDPTFAILQTPA